MDLSAIPLFSLLHDKLGYLTERQKLIAQNVANASTPGFTPQDLKPFEAPAAKSGSSVRMATPDHGIPIEAASSTRSLSAAQGLKSVAAPDSETTLDGNQVVLEEQMLKMSESRMDYEAAIGFYQKALAMLHMAVHKPGT